ncbi:transcriptional regulator [Burkholderia sp. Cy-647]|nr:transcriptional regulator [Burkholderia sp. Tr-860]NIF61745.1 transcriptional regulator [Burkholderia sp. Cy-647]NIF94046.1 transcriptional regulator [Burkholderia sp. Ax-1720]
MATNRQYSDLPQQEFLRYAMDQLEMTRDEFAARVSVARRTLDKWLLPSQSPDFRSMPDMGRSYVQEILEWQKKKA